MTKQYPVAPTQFINVLVTALPVVDEATKKVRYETSFEPKAIKVTSPDTVINYQLVGPTPEHVRFETMTVTPDQSQLSTPSIGQSGRVVTFSNANTRAETLNVTLHFIDRDLSRFAVDPEIKNEPPPTRAAGLTATAFAVDPEEPNSPPPTRFA